MKTLNKNSAYAYLNRIKTESEGRVNVSPYMRKVASSDTVPIDVLVFINRYIGLPQLYTYNTMYEKRKTHPLYKSLVTENLKIESKAKALSSLLTQVFIHTEQLLKAGKQEDIQEYMDIMNVRGITEALGEYAEGDDTKLNEVFMETRNVFKQLYKK